jgi:hypothetical protein
MDQRHNSRPEDDIADNEFEDVHVDENDAPESVQDIVQPGAPWGTFPDLLAPTNSSSACMEDDQPESQLSFTQRVRQSAEASGLHHHPHHQSSSTNPLSVSRSTGRDTGAIPKRVALPPDVSLMGGQASAISGNDLLSNAGPSAAQRSTLVQGRADQLAHDRVHELELNMVSLQTQKAILEQQLNQKDNQIRDLVDDASNQPPINSSLLSVAASVAVLTQAMETMSRDVSSRLSRLESRLNVLTVAENGAGVTLDSTASLRQELRVLSEEQRRQMEEDRTSYLLALSDALRAATITSSSPKNPDAPQTNGPR